eukprot:Tamp_20888.p1 GENE.Tamp_20888~~Tamp_20888.p1  ORF type:complete len:117 (+),score=13.96 Tamp_20888:84-434(+)
MIHVSSLHTVAHNSAKVRTNTHLVCTNTRVVCACACTYTGYIALHFAAKHSAKECVDLLLALESATAQACSKSKDSKYPHSLADDTGIGTQLKAFYDEEQKRLAEDAKKLKEGKKI